jgi:hypothetical protein
MANVVVEYFNNRSNNVTSAFPTTLTAALEAAYPGRVLRNAAGTITQIDRRAITLAEQREERIRWGSISGQSGQAGDHAGPLSVWRRWAARRRVVAWWSASGWRRARRSSGGPPGGPRYEGRWNLSLYHTVQFVDRVLVAQGGPVLNCWAAIADHRRRGAPCAGTGSGAFIKGIGLRFNGSWSAPTHVATPTTDLRFGAAAAIRACSWISTSVPR